MMGSLLWPAAHQWDRRNKKPIIFPLNFLTTNTRKSFFNWKPWQTSTSFRENPPILKMLSLETWEQTVDHRPNNILDTAAKWNQLQPVRPLVWDSTKQLGLFTKILNVSLQKDDLHLSKIQYFEIWLERTSWKDTCLYQPGKTTVFKIEMRPSSPELGHSCNALAIRVFAMFFSPALYSNRTDSNLVRKRLSDDI